MSITRLRRISNEEFDFAEQVARESGVPLSSCPTCGSKEELVRTDHSEYYGRVSRTYRYKGEEHECDCDTQITLRRHYIVAGIPQQYQRLDWDDYTRSKEVRDNVQYYIDNYEFLRSHGMGVLFGGPDLGTGKTFAATHIAKELVKKKRKVRFVRFLGMIEKLKDHAEEAHALNHSEVLILDEVIAPHYVNQGPLFADLFESLMRHRTDSDLPTILTTNLTSAQLTETYPRVMSVISPKTLPIDMSGDDFRLSDLAWENIDLVKNKEIRPIT